MDLKYVILYFLIIVCVKVGEYSDCYDVDLVVICVGVV